MLTISNPELVLSREWVLGLLTLAVLGGLALAGRSAAGSRGRRAWPVAAAGALALHTGLAPHALLYLPVLYLAAVWSVHQGTPRRQALFFWLQMLIAGGLGIGLAIFIEGSAARAAVHSALRPLLGWRWASNGLWLVLVGTAWLARGPLPHRPGAAGGPFLTSSGARNFRNLLVLTELVTLPIAALILLAPTGHRIFGAYLLGRLVSLLPAVILPAIRLRWTGGALILAIATCGVGPVLVFSTGADEPYPWSEVRGADLLLLDGHCPRPDLGEVPLDLARRGSLLDLEDLAALPDLIRNSRLDRSYDRLLVWTEGASPPSWLARLPGPATTGPCDLFRLRPGALPRPLFLYQDGVFQTGILPQEGMHEDGVWSGPRLALDLDDPHGPYRFLDLYLRGWRPVSAPDLLPGLEAHLDGRPLELVDHQITYFSWRVPSDCWVEGPGHLVLKAPGFVPADLDPESDDRRRLGLDLDRLLLR